MNSEITNPAVKKTGARLTQIDGLRALAALSVVAFHYTTRFDQKFVHNGFVPMSFPRGNLGVNLFFVISGFVILMTLQRTKAPLDFIVSRTSRLYPSYWCAVLLAWLINIAIPLPGPHLGIADLVVNFSMIQSLFYFPDVDGVYWTLLVELIFYVLMLMLWIMGLLKRPMRITALWVIGALLLKNIAPKLGFNAPWVIENFLLLDWIPWFSLGIAAYVLATERRTEIYWWTTVTIALVGIAMTGPILLAVCAIAAFGAVALAGQNKLRIAGIPALAFVGAISYPLYLVHESLGWHVIRVLEQHQFQPIVAIAVATVLAISVAYLIHRFVENPVMKWIRDAYRGLAKNRESFNRVSWFAGTALVFVALALGSVWAGQRFKNSESSTSIAISDADHLLVAALDSN